MHGDATASVLPAADVIYVNAGVVEPPVQWLEALNPGGRLIFPWQPVEGIGFAMLVTRASTGLKVRPLMPVRFIPCIGASDTGLCLRAPNVLEAQAIRSLGVSADQTPDETAVAVFQEYGFRQPPFS